MHADAARPELAERLGKCNEHKMTIHVRIWRGTTPRERADEYEQYNYEVGIRPLVATALAVQTLRRDLETVTEFTTISYWPSTEAMRAFTGREPTAIHHLPRDPEFLVELPQAIEIHELRAAHSLPQLADRAPG
jgi:hypothetical protein